MNLNHSVRCDWTQQLRLTNCLGESKGVCGPLTTCTISVEAVNWVLTRMAFHVWKTSRDHDISYIMSNKICFQILMSVWCCDTIVVYFSCLELTIKNHLLFGWFIPFKLGILTIHLFIFVDICKGGSSRRFQLQMVLWWIHWGEKWTWSQRWIWVKTYDLTRKGNILRYNSLVPWPQVSEKYAQSGLALI